MMRALSNSRPRLGLSAGLALGALLAVSAARADEAGVSADDPSEGYTLAPLSQDAGPGWSPKISGLPELELISPRSFGAGLGGSPAGTIDLGSLPGLGDWSPSMGIGPGAYDRMTNGR